MPVAYYPAWPIRLETEDGALGIDLPTHGMEWESQQEIRTAFETIPLGDYAADLLGTRRGPRSLAEESIRFIAVADSADHLEAWLMAFRGFVARMRRGKLWVRDATGVRRWCLVRPSALPEMTYGVEQTRIMPVVVRLERFTDWYAERPRRATLYATRSPSTFQVGSSGTVATRRVVVLIRLEPLQASLQVSGTVITDALRLQTTPSHFDGRAAESSVGLWRGTTNLVPNGGFETNTTGWNAHGGTTITRDTSQARHGLASLRVTTNGASTGQGIITPTGTSGMPVTGGTMYTYSAWLWGSGTVRLKLSWFASNGSLLGSSESANITLTSTPQRAVLTASALASAAYAAAEIVTPTAQAITFWVDAVQLEATPFPTPYVHTDGASASRTGPVVSLSATAVRQCLSEGQGWVAMRVRPSLSSATLPTGHTVTLFAWQNSPTTWLRLRLWESGVDSDLQLSSNPGGTVSVPATALGGGQSFLVVSAWTPQQLQLSVNGANFVTSPRSAVPNLSNVPFTLGGRWDGMAAAYLQGELLWVATGKGYMHHTDAARLANLGEADPSPSDFPPSAQLTGLWTCAYLGSTMTVVKPKLELLGHEIAIESQRTLSTVQQQLSIDGANFRVRYSANGGTTWSDDWANVVLGATQTELIRLEPGSNALRVSWAASSVNPGLWVDLTWYDAFA